MPLWHSTNLVLSIQYSQPGKFVASLASFEFHSEWSSCQREFDLQVSKNHWKDHCIWSRRHYSVDGRQVGWTPSVSLGIYFAYALIVAIAVVSCNYRALKREGFRLVREYVNLIAYRWWSVIDRCDDGSKMMTDELSHANAQRWWDQSVWHSCCSLLCPHDLI